MMDVSEQRFDEIQNELIEAYQKIGELETIRGNGVLVPFHKLKEMQSDLAGYRAGIKVATDRADALKNELEAERGVAELRLNTLLEVDAEYKEQLAAEREEVQRWKEKEYNQSVFANELMEKLTAERELSRKLYEALTHISLCEFNSMSSRQEMGRLSREAIAAYEGARK